MKQMRSKKGEAFSLYDIKCVIFFFKIVSLVVLAPVFMMRCFLQSTKLYLWNATKKTGGEYFAIFFLLSLQKTICHCALAS